MEQNNSDFYERKLEGLDLDNLQVPVIKESPEVDLVKFEKKSLIQRILEKKFPGNTNHLTDDDKRKAYDDFVKIHFKNTGWLGTLISTNQSRDYTDIELAEKLVEINYAFNSEDAKPLVSELINFTGKKFTFYQTTPRMNKPTYFLGYYDACIC